MNMDRKRFLLGGGAALMGAAVPGVARGKADGPGIDYSRRLVVTCEADVVVAGGGPAGTAAAVAAATRGAKVFLIEGHTSFGGMSTAGRVPVFMPFGDGVRTLATGFATQVQKGLAQERGFGNSPATDLEAFKRVYDDLVVKAGVDFRFSTRVVDAIREGARISHVVCAGPSGMFAVKGKVFVDATGNADLAVFAGASVKKGDASGTVMPGTLCSLWAGMDWERWKKERPKKPKTFRGWADFIDPAIADGVFLEPDRHLTGFERLGKDLAAANMGHAFGLDATDDLSLTKAFVRCRAQMKEWQRYFREYVKRGTENIQLVATGELMGVRESRRVVADYTLSLQDYLARARFEDEIGRYAYPIDIHPSKGDKAEMAKFKKRIAESKYGPGESYGIPYRSLVAKGLVNLLVAGRCIGTDQYMQASVRVIPGCYITGQAAGLAAALSVRNGGEVRAVDTPALQSAIRSFGGFLG